MDSGGRSPTPLTARGGPDPSHLPRQAWTEPGGTRPPLKGQIIPFVALCCCFFFFILTNKNCPKLSILGDIFLPHVAVPPPDRRGVATHPTCLYIDPWGGGAHAVRSPHRGTANVVMASHLRQCVPEHSRKRLSILSQGLGPLPGRLTRCRRNQNRVPLGLLFGGLAQVARASGDSRNISSPPPGTLCWIWGGGLPCKWLPPTPRRRLIANFFFRV